MAFSIEYTDQYGEVYPEAYFKLVQCNISLADKTGMVMFYGYPSEAQKGKRIIGQKQYAINTDAYDAYFVTTELNPEGENPYKAAYVLASSVKDVGESPAEGEPDERVSFFENAEVV